MSDDRTRSVTEVWESVAPAWDRHRDRVFAQTRLVSDWIVDHVDPQPGQTLLELGAGPGETGFVAADRLGPGGRLISTDVSPRMVDAARRASRHRNLTNVEHRVMDAQRLDLEDASVDAVISRFTFMLVPEPQRVFAEVHRVLRAGGRFAYAVWGDMERNPWVTVIIGALLANGHALGGDGPFAPGGLFSLAAAETNAELLTAAGFVEVGVAESLGEMTAETFDEYWEVQTSLAGPVTRLLETLSAEQVDAVRASAEAGAEPYRTQSGYRLPYTANVVAARRPER